MHMKRNLPLIATGLALIGGCGSPHPKPNILLVIADDWSWPHASVAGEPEIRTPAFDRIAREGVLFNNAFCSSPSCTPSRGALLSGQYHWRLQEGANLWSSLPAGIPVYPDILEKSGYFTGFTGKGWGPGYPERSGRSRNPAGPEFNDRKMKAPKGIGDINYTANFREFLRKKPKDKPFSFWYGAFEPHRDYQFRRGESLGKDPAKVRVPGFMPDADTIRQDILDYYAEVEWLDTHLDSIIRILGEAGELDNTLIICTSDNGMPFPAAKSNLYEYGTHMPLAIRWGSRIKPGRTVDDLVSLTDLAPTILSAAGCPIPDAVTGKDLIPLLTGKAEGPIRPFVLTGKERHAWVRPNGEGYPSRAIRTPGYLLIYNFEPGRWPAGNPDFAPGDNLSLNYGDIDNSPAKRLMYDHRNDPADSSLIAHAFMKHPRVELFDVAADPYNLNNLAGKPEYRALADSLQALLFRELERTGDPRISGKGEIFDTYPYYGGGRPLLVNDTAIYTAQGVMTGEITDHSVILQTRLTAAPRPVNGDVPGKKGIARMAIDRDSTFQHPAYTDWKVSDSVSDYILRWTTDTLQPHTRYFYRLEYGTHGNSIRQGQTGRFSTLPGPESAESVSFMVVTGMNYGKFYYGQTGTPEKSSDDAATGPDRLLGFPALETITAMAPSFFVSTGDNVYYDDPWGPWAATTPAGMRKKWHEQFVQPRFQQMFLKVPTFWQKDDHDHRYNDCDTTGDMEPTNALGKRIFLEQVPVTMDIRDEQSTIRTIRVNRHLQIWLPEGRDHRSPNALPDGPQKSIWGAKQKEWLKQSLLASDATFRILISPTPMVGPDDAYKSDNHTNQKGFRNEGEAFFKWLDENHIPRDRFFIVCGDRHWQYHARHPSGYEEFSTGAFVDANSRAGRLAGDPKSTDPGSLIHQFFVQGPGQASGGFLNIRQQTDQGVSKLIFTFYDEHGKVHYSVTRGIN